MRMEQDKWYVGIDLGGTKIGAGLVNTQGRVLVQDYCETLVSQGREAVIGRMVDAIRRVIGSSHIALDQIAAIGIGSPGPLDIPQGLILESPNLPALHHTPIRQILAEALNIPTFLENDANAAAIGEYLYGAGRGTRHMIYITVSTGIGGGLILDGKIYQGATGGGGEVGHMTLLPNGPRCGCGNRGCLEALASGTAIARAGQELVQRGAPTRIAGLTQERSGQVTAKDVVDAMYQGDPFAQDIVDQAMYYLGWGVASLVNLFNPQIVVIGGGLSNLGDRLLSPVRRGVDLHAYPSAARQVQIRLAELGNQVGIVGAAGAAMMAAGHI